MSDAAAQTVLSFYSFPPGMVRRIENLGNAGGWSGSQIWKVEVVSVAGIMPVGSAVGNALRGVPGTAASPEFLCLRRWPREHPTPERLQLIHAVLSRVWEGGLHIVPVPLRTGQDTAFVEYEGHLWELTPWMPGIADFHANPARERLRSAMQALARFHLLAVSEGTPGFARHVVPAVHLRHTTLRRIAEHCTRINAHLQPALGAEFDSRAIRLLRLMCDLGEEFAPRLGALQERVWYQQPVIRDIWHDHVLFTGDQVTGIVDFGAMNIDTPLTDVARLLGSLVGDDRPLRRFALAAYREVQPLDFEGIQIIDLLDYSGQVVAAVNWLTWLYVDRRDMGPPEPIIRRLDEILRRLEHLAAR